MGNADALRLPVVSLGAEHLVIGHLMRRNVLAYKAPPNHEGYDLICIHPNPRSEGRQIRVQVKSRYQTDCDRAFPVKARTFELFDYVVVVFLNIGFFYLKRDALAGRKAPEFYTLPRTFIEGHHRTVKSGFEKVHTRGVDLSQYENEAGFEQIARDLGITYPARPVGRVSRSPIET
ncbi:MAG: hypothetical protein WCC53_08295 [Thermoanaerobaculia bacterium]